MSFKYPHHPSNQPWYHKLYAILKSLPSNFHLKPLSALQQAVRRGEGETEGAKETAVRRVKEKALKHPHQPRRQPEPASSPSWRRWQRQPLPSLHRRVQPVHFNGGQYYRPTSYGSGGVTGGLPRKNKTQMRRTVATGRTEEKHENIAKYRDAKTYDPGTTRSNNATRRWFCATRYLCLSRPYPPLAKRKGSTPPPINVD